MYEYIVLNKILKFLIYLRRRYEDQIILYYDKSRFHFIFLVALNKRQKCPLRFSAETPI